MHKGRDAWAIVLRCRAGESQEILRRQSCQAACQLAVVEKRGDGAPSQGSGLGIWEDGGAVS